MIHIHLSMIFQEIHLFHTTRNECAPNWNIISTLHIWIVRSFSTLLDYRLSIPLNTTKMPILNAWPKFLWFCKIEIYRFLASITFIVEFKHQFQMIPSKHSPHDCTKRKANWCTVLQWFGWRPNHTIEWFIKTRHRGYSWNYNSFPHFSTKLL